MAVKKVSRKKLLKEPDEFISTTAKIIQFLQDHRRQMTLYGIIVLAVLAAGAGGYQYLRWQAEKALRLQQDGMQLYQEALAKSGEGDSGKENFRKALEKFREARKVYDRGNAGQISEIYIGHSHYALKEYDQAIQAYSRCVEGPFRAVAYDGLGHAYEAKGDYAKAQENYLRNTATANPYQMEDLLNLARCYEAQNQKQKALETYQQALAKGPKSSSAEFIQWKIGELKG